MSNTEDYINRLENTVDDLIDEFNYLRKEVEESVKRQDKLTERFDEMELVFSSLNKEVQRLSDWKRKVDKFIESAKDDGK